MRPQLALFAIGVAVLAAGVALDGGWWLLWVAGALAVVAGLAALPRGASWNRRAPVRHAAPGPMRYRTGDHPGPGRYRCELCLWVVQLEDDPAEVGTGPVATPGPEARPGDAPLPVCLGCGGMDAPIYERIPDEVPDAARRSPAAGPAGGGRPAGGARNGAEGRSA